MKNSKFLPLCLLLLAIHAAQASETAAIEAAAKKYVAANSGMTQVTAIVGRIEGKFARAKVTPEGGATDPVWVFLKIVTANGLASHSGQHSVRKIMNALAFRAVCG